MRDALPYRPYEYERAIVNLDSKHGVGTHWVCYVKQRDRVYYFDSFGNLKPPIELIHYFGSNIDLHYNYERQQSFDSVVCGHLCLNFLLSR